jgi:hypothetical protein
MNSVMKLFVEGLDAVSKLAKHLSNDRMEEEKWAEVERFVVYLKNNVEAMKLSQAYLGEDGKVENRTFAVWKEDVGNCMTYGQTSYEVQSDGSMNG